MFKKLFKKNTESTKDTKKVVIPCTCDKDNEHCDLILQLRNCQDFKKRIEDEIKMLDDGRELLNYTINFLKKLEENGLHMSRINSYMNYDASIYVIKDTIDNYSSDDIFRITEELKTYRNKVDIICEKQRTLKLVKDDIKNIKIKLGIE